MKNNIIVTILSALLLLFLMYLINAVISVVMGVKDTFYGLTQKPMFFLAFIVLMLMAYYFIYKYVLRLRLIKPTTKHFVTLITVMVVMFITVIATSTTDLLHDPKTYYEEGLLIKEDFRYFNFSNIYHQRVIFYTVPIFTFIGEQLKHVQVVNSVLLLASISIYTFLIYKEYGKQVAFLFLLISAFTLEYYWLATLASHDIASLFYFSLLLWAVYSLQTSTQKYRSLGLIIGVAFLIVINDIQRTIKLPILVALLFLALAQIRNFNHFFKINFTKKLLSAILLSIGLIFLLGRLNSNTNNSTHYDLENVIYSYNQLNTIGDYKAGEEVRRNFIPLVSQPSKQELTLEKFFTQVTDYPLETLQLMKAKLTTLALLNPQDYYYMDKKFNSTKQNFIVYQLIKIVAYGIKLFTLILAVFGLLRLLLQETKSNWFSKLYILYPLVLLPMLLLSEINSTYTILIYPTILFFAAYGLQWWFQEERIFKQFKINYRILIGSGITLIGLTIFAYFSAYAYTSASQESIIDFRKDRYDLSAMAVMDDGETKGTNSFEIHLKVLNSDQPNVLNIKLKEEAKSIRFFLRTKALPHTFKVFLNDQNIFFKNYKEDSRSEGQGDNYYYFEHDFNNFKKQLILKFEDVQEVLIKDIMIN